MNNNVYIGIIIVVLYVFLLPLLILGGCISLYTDNITYLVTCCIGCIVCLLSIGVFNRQYKSLTISLGVVAVFTTILVMYGSPVWKAIGIVMLVYSALSYLNIIVYLIKKMNSGFYKVCTICFLLMFGAFVYVEYLNALNKRFYILDNLGERMYDNWTGGVYINVSSNNKMYYFDVAKDREKAIYMKSLNGDGK